MHIIYHFLYSYTYLFIKQNFNFAHVGFVHNQSTMTKYQSILPSSTAPSIDLVHDPYFEPHQSKPKWACLIPAFVLGVLGTAAYFVLQSKGIQESSMQTTTTATDSPPKLPDILPTQTIPTDEELELWDEWKENMVEVAQQLGDVLNAWEQGSSQEAQAFQEWWGDEREKAQQWWDTMWPKAKQAASEDTKKASEWATTEAKDAGQWMSNTANKTGKVLGDDAKKAGKWAQSEADDAGKVLGSAENKTGTWIENDAQNTKTWVQSEASNVGQRAGNEGKEAMNWTKQEASSVGQAVGEDAEKTEEWVEDESKKVGHWISGAANKTGNWVDDETKETGEWVHKEEGVVGEDAKAAGNWIKGEANKTGHWVDDETKETGEWFRKDSKAAGKWFHEEGNVTEHWVGDEAGKTGEWFDKESNTTVHWMSDKARSSADWFKKEDNATTNWLKHETNSTRNWFVGAAAATKHWFQHDSDSVKSWWHNLTNRESVPDETLLYFNSTPAFTMLADGSGWYDFSRDYFIMQLGWDVQENQAYCGVATSATVINSLRGMVELPIDSKYNPYPYATQDSLFNDCAEKHVVRRNVTFDGVLSVPGGLSLDQTQALLQCNLPNETWSVEAHHVDPSVISLEEMRKDLITALMSPSSRVMVNFNRAEANQVGGGHFSPIGSYSHAKDAFLIMDVAKYKYPAVWMPAQVLYRSLGTVDACGIWDYPHAQDKLMLSHPELMHPKTPEEFGKVVRKLGCKAAYRGYITVNLL